LYDLKQLAKNEVKVSAATWVLQDSILDMHLYLTSLTLFRYFEDMWVPWPPRMIYFTHEKPRYVPFELSQQTAAKVQNTEQYITNQLVHNGIRQDPKDVMKRLFELSRREFA
jgi:hypothetical protein